LDNGGHSTFIDYLTGISVNFFGRNFTAIRLPSIIFGSLTISLFYILLRQYFKKSTSIFSSLLFSFSYPHVVVSRFAYEIAPAIFFQVFAILFLYLAWKKAETKYFIATGLAIGIGLLTYIGFRTHALILLLLCVILCFYSSKIKKKTLVFILICIAIFISTIPLFSYSINHPKDVFERANQVSVFAQNFPPDRVLKEIGGNTVRSLLTLFSYPDPNVRHNPSGVGIFDPLTLILFFSGLVFLFAKKRNLFYIAILLLIPSFINDILSVEIFPEYHYFGVGHPNTLRVAGLIPIIYVLSSFGIESIENFTSKTYKQFKYFVIPTVVLLILVINWNNYFNQKINSNIYLDNGSPMFNVINFIEDNNIKIVYLSPGYFYDPRIKYFLENKVIIRKFLASKSKNTTDILPSKYYIIFDVKDDTNLAQDIVNLANANPAKIKMQLLNNEWGYYDSVIVFKNK
jgi:4-amino-4-deoxy-L-arabinose transferase-like glycosyltransferase